MTTFSSAGSGVTSGSGGGVMPNRSRSPMACGVMPIWTSFFFGFRLGLLMTTANLALRQHHKTGRDGLIGNARVGEARAMQQLCQRVLGDGPAANQRLVKLHACQR